MIMLKRSRAFSLIELVIVVVILGIIAAIAVPRISSSSQSSGEAACRANLSTLRTAIDRYYAEHNNTFPGAVGDGTNAALSQEALLNQLTKYTNIEGVYSDEKTAAFPFGPYIRSGFPKQTVGPNSGENSVGIVYDNKLEVKPSGGEGWKYNALTGEILANSQDAGLDGITHDKY
ncbi:MAG: prepilin-type N-terminal cleavage/methylation domain-containing protein [Sedimentisphaerales bacterium]|nr:prepilin-type N-terminal cleavage/methylation domain-containing protein [Sedimentisphaerales bacterium]